MSAKDKLNGPARPRKLNPNLLLIGIVIVILTIIVVYSGRHTRITVQKVFSIDANIPPSTQDSAKNANRQP